MAKESMKARERKRAKTVAKYAAKRKALKDALVDSSCSWDSTLQIHHCKH